jgi:NADPH2:quinone reductase
MTQTHAIRIHGPGGPEKMVFEAVELPPPAPHEVRVKNAAIGLNFIDIYHRTGLYPLPLPAVLGMEGAGVVEEVGAEVEGLQAGDRVGYCSGPVGAYAERRNLPATRAIPLPASISFEMAAGILLQGLTTHYLIHDCFEVKRGTSVLLHAAAGGVGSLLSQWAVAKGARVIGTVGSEEKAALAKAQGCAETILYSKESFPMRVRELTQGRGVDVVYDSVGASTFLGSLESLAVRGTAVSFGQASGKIPPFDISLLAKGSLTLTRPGLAHFTSDAGEMLKRAAELFAAIDGGAIKVKPPQIFALKEASAAHQALESRLTTGSIILKP